MAKTAPDAGDDTGPAPDRAATTGTSRWQKVIGIIGLVVVLWVGSEMYEVVFGDLKGGNHGPGRDAPVENQDEEIDTDDGGGHTPPAGGH